MSDLDELRQRKLQEIQQAFQEQQETQKQIGELEAVVKTRLTKDALQRYGNIKAAYPDKAVQLLVIIGQAIQNQNITQITDAQLKDLLLRLSPKKEFTIRRK
ncbi:MAG: DNA-binding protein [Candidatus Woesearchaeota archaeon]